MFKDICALAAITYFVLAVAEWSPTIATALQH